jgi:hypothetical protein
MWTRTAWTVFRALLATLLVVGAALAATATATATERGECHRVKAVGVGQDLGGGNTTATISHGGFLNGTTAAHFDITGGSPPVFTIQGTLVLTARHGTLTLNVSGTFNVATGAFDASGSVASGTGKLAGATGTLVFSGVEDLTTGAFTETIAGQLCRSGDGGDGLVADLGNAISGGRAEH